MIPQHDFVLERWILYQNVQRHFTATNNPSDNVPIGAMQAGTSWRSLVGARGPEPDIFQWLLSSPRLPSRSYYFLSLHTAFQTPKDDPSMSVAIPSLRIRLRNTYPYVRDHHTLPILLHCTLRIISHFPTVPQRVGFYVLYPSHMASLDTTRLSIQSRV